MRLEEYFKQAQLLTYKKGCIILRPDNLPIDVYYIEEGFIRVYGLTEWGDEKLFIIYKAGELFPLFWIFDKLPVKRFYEVLGNNVKLRKLSKSDFLKIINTDPEALLGFNKKIVDIFEVLNDRIDSLEYTNSYARLISRLLNLAQRFGKKHGRKAILNLPISHKDIASSIALSRETISREFEKLEKKGFVKYRNHLIEIIDIDALQKEMSDHFNQKFS